jgi:hypothetical protein
VLGLSDFTQEAFMKGIEINGKLKENMIFTCHCGKQFSYVKCSKNNYSKRKKSNFNSTFIKGKKEKLQLLVRGFI